MSRHWADIIIDHHLIVVIHNNALSHCCCCCCGCLCWCCCHTNCIVVVHKWIVENFVNFYLRILFYLIIKNDFFFNFTHYPLKCCTRFVSFFFFQFSFANKGCNAMRAQSHDLTQHEKLYSICRQRTQLNNNKIVASIYGPVSRRNENSLVVYVHHHTHTHTHTNANAIQYTFWCKGVEKLSRKLSNSITVAAAKIAKPKIFIQKKKIVSIVQLFNFNWKKIIKK